MKGNRIAGVALACVVIATCASCGPRMRRQIAIQPYERQMPAMPAGTVPTRGRLQSVTTHSALPASRAALNNGRIYYGYYCRMCHGVKGDGNGPVGQSYVPKPTDLSSEAVARLTDSQLYTRMLHGVGHDPVMVQTVPVGQRRQIVAYVRKCIGRQWEK